MPTFDTPAPISATIDLAIGDVRISAGDRGTTVVEVQPSDASDEQDVKAAELTRVEYDDERLVVKTPELRSWSAQARRVDRPDDRPARRLARAWHRGGGGRPLRRPARRLPDQDRPRPHPARPGRHAASEQRRRRHQRGPGRGPRRGHPGSGDVRLGELDRSAVVKNSNGDTWIGVAGGDLRVNAANGSIAVDLAQGGVAAKSANGDVRAGRGRARLGRARDPDRRRRGRHPRGHRRLARRQLPVGRVHNALDAADAPDASAETVEVRARTSVGEVVIRRP